MISLNILKEEWFGQMLVHHYLITEIYTIKELMSKQILGLAKLETESSLSVGNSQSKVTDGATRSRVTR